MNMHAEDFLAKAKERFDEDTSDMTQLDWLRANTTLRGKPFSVKGYEFQETIINDTHPNMDVIKPSQTGITEIQVRKMLAMLVRNRGIGGIFSLPNEKMYDRVSKTRFKPLVDKDEVFNKSRDQNSIRSRGLMQFGESFLYVTGCTEGDATSTPADVVFNDEVDLSPQQILALYQSRLQNSSMHINQRFGTPTFPQFGVDLGFQSSDQHLYLVKCQHCNHWQHPEFNTDFIVISGLPDWVYDLSNLDMETIDELAVDDAYVKCEKCHRALDLADPEARQWVPKHPSRRKARGYRVSPFATPHLGPAYIVSQLREYRKRDNLRGFFNTVLGQPYTDGNIQLSRDEINECFNGQPTVPEIPAGEPVCVGIDMGQTCHVVLGCGTTPKNMHAFWFKAVHVDDIVEEVRNICDQYTVVAGACDRHPYEPTADDIFRASSGKIVPAEYRGSKEVNLVQDATGAEFSHAQVDRTKMLDEVVRYIRISPGLTFSGYGQNRETITNHLRDMIRDEQPDQPAKWVKLSGEDHFFHALGFLLVSLKIKEVERAKSKSDARSVLSYSSVDFQDIGGNIFGNGKRESVLG